MVENHMIKVAVREKGIYLLSTKYATPKVARLFKSYYINLIPMLPAPTVFKKRHKLEF